MFEYNLGIRTELWKREKLLAFRDSDGIVKFSVRQTY